MTTITIIDNEKYYYNGKTKCTKIFFNVWEDDGRVLFRGADIIGKHVSRDIAKKIVSTNYLNAEEYFEQYEMTLGEAKLWAFDKYGYHPE